jgi:predicted kinase
MKPILILIDGPMGSGKSTLSKILQRKINSALLSMDVIKKFLNDFQNAEKSSKRFAKYEITSMISQSYLKKGISVIIEQSLGDKKSINLLLKNAKPKNIRSFIFKIDAPLEVRIRRVIKRDKQNKKELISKILKDNNSFKNDFEYDAVYNTSEISLENISSLILEKINLPKAKV